MRIPVAAAATVAALVLVGCGFLPRPAQPAVANRVDTEVEGDRTTWTVSPWPFAETVAFLCLEQPGDRFGLPDAQVADPSGCARLLQRQDRDVIRLTFDPATTDPAVVERLGAGGPPWYLAVAGASGSASGTIVTEIIDSPIPSDAGPS